MRALSLLLAVLVLGPLSLISGATPYTVTHITVHMFLNPDTSAHVNETIQLSIGNQSVQQYQTNRVALNLTLSQWQQLAGTQVTEHILNPKNGNYNFDLLTGPVTEVGYNTYAADLVLSYDVNNVSTVNQTSPRVFVYTLRSNVFNFQHGASGEVLSPNTTLNITVPQGSRIKSVSPIPDAPAYGITNNYANVTTVTWYRGEPLSAFSLVFVVNQSLRDEVLAFFTGVYKTLGIYAYVLIAAVILLFVLYVYYRASK
ncbi:MAG: hypothetical protein KGH94_02295 [Candidatus Micrarchaeota archaeon]|nr:hypothetical protein [Candidatus Micrarchaeota archaeon]